MSQASGLRVVIATDDDVGLSTTYRGSVWIESETHHLVARVDGSGVELQVEPPLLPDQERLVRALIRAATKSAIAAGEVPPRRIARWRALRPVRGRHP